MLDVRLGRLALANDVISFLPVYFSHGTAITIERLLTHMSGIVGHTGKHGFRRLVGIDLTAGLAAGVIAYRLSDGKSHRMAMAGVL